MDNKYKLNIRYAFFIFCLYILIFQNFLQNHISFLKYFDELLAILSIPFLVLSILKKNVNKDKFKNNILIILSLFLIFCIGIISNICFKYQSVQYILSDMLVFYKFYLILFFAEKLWNFDFLEKYKKKILFHTNFIVITFFMLTIFNYIFTIWPAELRYGILANKLFYSQPTFLAGICIFLLCLSIRLNKKIINYQTFLILIILFSTLRIKAIGGLIAILLLTFYVNKTNKKISLFKIIVVGLVLLFFAFDQVMYYFFENDGFARKELLNTSFKIASDYFPLGSGFATYGSYYSAVNYSPIYYIYQLDNIYGLQPTYYAFAADSFFPMIIGQFGFLGLLCYLWCLLLLFKKIQLLNISQFKFEYISKLCAFVYIIICSTSESAFAGPMAIPLAIIIGINDYEKDRSKEDD